MAPFFSQIYMSGSLVVVLSICSSGSLFLSDLHEWQSFYSTIKLFKWPPLSQIYMSGSLVILPLMVPAFSQIYISFSLVVLLLICSSGSLFLSDLHEWQSFHSTINLFKWPPLSQIYMSGSLVVLLICSHGSFFLADQHE